MTFVRNDGGRFEAGFKGETSDCVVRATAIVTKTPYKIVYDEINKLSQTGNYKRKSNSRTGVYKDVKKEYLKSK